MRISDWSSDVCSSDLQRILMSFAVFLDRPLQRQRLSTLQDVLFGKDFKLGLRLFRVRCRVHRGCPARVEGGESRSGVAMRRSRSEEHTSELQSLMRISYAVFCLKKKIN